MAEAATTAASSATSADAGVTSFPFVPLTTTFTPPAACSGIYSSMVGIIDDKTSCLPSGFEVAPTAYFSPGIACPSGYYSACHDTTGVPSITTVTCCPFRGSISLSCVDDPSALFNIWSTLFCTWRAAPSGEAVVWTVSPNGRTSTATTTMTDPEGLNAFGVRMLHQSTDTASKTSSETSNPSRTSTDSASTSHTTREGLSTGGVVAIAVVVPVVVLALLGAGFFWWRKRRRMAAGGGQPQGIPGADGQKYYWQEVPQELSGNLERPAELPDNRHLAQGPAQLPD